MNNLIQSTQTSVLELPKEDAKAQNQIERLTKEQESSIKGGCGCKEIRIRR